MMERTLKLKLLLWFYSSANIAGCALALLGPARLFLGVIDTGWLRITAGPSAVRWPAGGPPRAGGRWGGRPVRSFQN